jgi:uncharacterized protein YaiL (DUF2058 family)
MKSTGEKEMKTRFKVGDLVQTEWLGGRVVICKITQEKNGRFEIVPVDYLSHKETSAMRCWVNASRLLDVV